MIGPSLAIGRVTTALLVSGCGNGDACSVVNPRMVITIDGPMCFDGGLVRVMFANGAGQGEDVPASCPPITMTLPYPPDAVNGDAQLSVLVTTPDGTPWIGGAFFVADVNQCTKLAIDVAIDTRADGGNWYRSP